MAPRHRLDEFRLARKLVFLNRFTQSILLVLLVLGINIFAIRFIYVWDITENNTNTLSPETIAYMQRIDDPVVIYVLVSPNFELEGNFNLLDNLKSLMNRYLVAANQLDLDGFRVVYIDPYTEREAVLQLKEQFNSLEDNSVLVLSHDRSQIIDVSEFFEEAADGDWLFNGEMLVTSAILEVVNPVPQTILFTVGHGEMRLNDTDGRNGLSEVSQFLSQRSFELGEFDISQYETIPQDIDLLVIANPQRQFVDQDIEKLRQYLENGYGSVILFKDSFSEHSFGRLFADWGIWTEPSAIIDPGPDYQAVSGNLLLRRFATHPITQGLIDQKLYLYSRQPRPVMPSPQPALLSGVTLEPLVASSTTSWIERSLGSDQLPRYDADRDTRGPVPLVILAEREGGENLGLNLRGGKLIVIGDSSLISNELFQLSGNRLFILNCIHWCAQSEYLLNVMPAELATYRLSLSEQDLYRLLIYLLIIPLVFLILAVTMRILRR